MVEAAPPPRPPRAAALQSAPSKSPRWGPGSCLQCGNPDAPYGAWAGPVKVAVCAKCAKPIESALDLFFRVKEFLR